MKKYGLTQAEYLQRLADQGGVCYICKQDRKLHVDHDHATGLVRKLLCPDCNTAIGLFRENTESMRRAIEYLENS